MNSKALLLVLACAMAGRASAQSVARPLLTQKIDDTQMVALHGTVHPLAQARYDRGAVPDSFAANRILLLLSRPPEREAALQQFLNDVHRRGLANYHRWLTPQEFGAQFGPADSDIQAAEDWLNSAGFSVARATKSKQYIEFSGMAGQLRKAFRTEIHQYNVNGETHYANATEVSIPAALAQLVRGVSPLNDFRAKPYVRVRGTALYSPARGKATPEWTAPNDFGTSNPNIYLLAPEDFATQYDLGPLYQAGVKGAGETIGIINESNIDVSQVNAYQQLFGLPNNPPQVVIDGDDPGTLEEVNVEAYLDVEVSGAVAPGATVNLYIAGGSTLQDPLQLAAVRAVEDNQASVLSISFGNCESGLGVAGNQFWNDLWEQAAAQGQTVFVAAGDSGPACNIFSGNAVSGIASTPWNVAVGGTDFYYSDYATGGASATTLWNATNDANLGSLKAPLPEQAWNDGFGLDVISDGLERGEIGAGGGGPSSCVTIVKATSACVSGYAKPAWQSGPGVPSDGVRDLPDVALYASNGANLSAWPICAYAGECAVGTSEGADVLVVGGTSASSPAMAAIMALVDEKYGRQGQANYTLYALAQQKPLAFHDITLGNNFVLCSEGTPDCVVDPSDNQVYMTTVYSAGPNYDMATGLGSVDANVFVNDWNSLNFLPTTTTLQLSSTSITHGAAITATASVSGTSGSGTPTGAVGIVTNSPSPASQGQTSIALNAGTGSSSIDYFPGGYYDVTANYQGDGVFGSSTSTPVALTVKPENSNINFTMMSGQTPVGAGGSVAYNAPFTLNIQPIGMSAATGQSNGNATGTATFTVDAISQAVALNVAGTANWTPPALAPGMHAAGATHSGDASFNASTSGTPLTFSVTKGFASINDNINSPRATTFPGYNVNVGGSLTITVVVGPFNGAFESGQSAPLNTVAPTGTVTACLGTLPEVGDVCVEPSYSVTATLASPSGVNAQNSSATVTFTNLAAGNYFSTYNYSGDANWQAGGLFDLSTINVVPAAALTASTTTLSITPATISGPGAATIMTVVSGAGNSGIAPTGEVDYYNNGVFLTYALMGPPSAGATNTVSFSLDASSFWTNGPNQITAIYLGNTNYLPSTSNAANLTVTQNGGDFTIAPQIPQIAVNAGASGTVGLNLASLNNFDGVVNLTCATSSSQISCGVNPAAPTLNGAATATLTINASASASAQAVQRGKRLGWLGSGGGFALASVFLIGCVNRKRRLTLLLQLCLFGALFGGLVVVAGCGNRGSQIVQQPPPPPPNGVVYSVVVSATASNGIVHNAKLTVIVP
ncbi:MAG: protease pro-enzyme activation domain-containing protein [Candidatus Acidiferrum sp.]